MLSFPNAKINLGLRVLSKREDGYHTLESCMYPVHHLTDALEILPSDEDKITCLGQPLDIAPQDNLVYKAYLMLQQRYPQIGHNHIILQKKIPSGAGLGGGSADCGFILRMLREKYKLDISDEQLIELSSQLGADVPFFILNTPSLVTGIGEILRPISLDLSDYDIRIISSPLHISTAWAFSECSPDDQRPPLSQCVEKPVSEWRYCLENDFEDIVFEKYPELKSNKEKLYQEGAVYASLTGTGSAVYGLFSKSTA